MIKINRKKYTRNKPRIPRAELVVNYFSVLNPQQAIELDYLIQKGTTQWELVSILQKEWNVFTDIKPKTLRDRISEYNTHVLKPKIIAGAENIDVYKELMVLKDKVDSVKEFTLLVLQQKQRLERALVVERQLAVAGLAPPKETSTTARKEIKLMADILERLAKIQLETGALKRAPKFISGEFQQSEDDPTKLKFEITENFAQVLESIDVEFKDVLAIDAPQ